MNIFRTLVTVSVFSLNMVSKQKKEQGFITIFSIQAHSHIVVEQDIEKEDEEDKREGKSDNRPCDLLFANSFVVAAAR